MKLIGLWPTGVSAVLAKHPVEETTRRLGLLGRLVVVHWERVLQLAVRDGAVDIYKVGALVVVVALHDGLGGLIGEANGGVGRGRDGRASGRW